MTPISLGLDTFGDVSVGPDGRPQSMDRVLREILDQATLAFMKFHGAFDHLHFHFL